jgi:hypothetical protein
MIWDRASLAPLVQKKRPIKDTNMDGKIIIALDEQVSCPKCGNHFGLHEGITHQTIERYEHELELTLAASRKEIEERAERTARTRAASHYEAEIKHLSDQLGEQKKAATDARAAVAAARVDERKKAVDDFSAEKRVLTLELTQKETKLKEFRQNELDLRAEKNRLEEQQQGMELELQRKLDEERHKLQTTIAAAESEKSRFREAELRKQIEDAKRTNEELSRKLEQKSQQLQGEVLELEVERSLSCAFPYDQIEPVKKGCRGADVVQVVRTPAGEVCGRIVWETKRAENWSAKWLQKLKEDQQEIGAEIPVLVTTVMPKGIEAPFIRVEDVWVIRPHVLVPVAEILRTMLMEAHRLKMVNTGRAEKMEILYRYLSSSQFAQKIRMVLETFESMRTDLESEKKAIQRVWAKRQTQLEKVTGSIVSMCGELQAIAEGSLPEFEVQPFASLGGEIRVLPQDVALNNTGVLG